MFVRVIKTGGRCGGPKWPTRWWWGRMVEGQSQWLPSWTECWWSCSPTFIGALACVHLTICWYPLENTLHIHFSPNFRSMSHSNVPLIVVKWSHCFITVLKNLLMSSNDILRFDKWENGDSTQRRKRPRSPHYCDQFPILPAALMINNLSIIKAKTTTLKRVRVRVEGQRGDNESWIIV